MVITRKVKKPQIDLEKVFDRVPGKVLWWVLRSLGVEECGHLELFKTCMLMLVVESV